jgi:hypothetical protein
MGDTETLYTLHKAGLMYCMMCQCQCSDHVYPHNTQSERERETERQALYIIVRMRTCVYVTMCCLYIHAISTMREIYRDREKETER